MTAGPTLGIIILAAGSSSRMGQAKQLLPLGNKNLLSHTIDEAKMVEDALVLVILGGNYEAIAAQMPDSDTRMVHHQNWQQGMGSSISKGMEALMVEQPQLEMVILAVCDQPYLTADLLRRLVAKRHAAKKNIVASAYKETLGTPVLFSKQYFSDLAALQGKEGAKVLLQKYENDVASVPFENGGLDIDTPEDYNRLISKTNDKGFLQPDT